MNERFSMSKRMHVSKNSTSIKIISLHVPRTKSHFISGDNDYNSTRILKREILRDPSTNDKFSLSVRLCETGEKFVLHDCHHNMTIRELKKSMEIVVGIPTDIQRVCYLDKGDLHDDTTIHCNYIIPGTALSLMIWPYNGWVELVIAAATGNIFKLKRVMSKPEPPYSCRPRSEDSPSWLSHRLFSALYICAHRGHLPAVCFLLQCGADVKGQTPLGRGALHVAAAQGQVQTILELLEQGSPVGMEDADGLTALSTAMRFHQKKSARQLFLFHWQARAKSVRLKPHLDEAELFAHQKHDSRLLTWYQGVRAQRYMAHLGSCSRGGNAGQRKPARPQNAAVGAKTKRAWIGDT